MGLLAIIGGSGFRSLPGFDVEARHAMPTPYGQNPVELLKGRFNDLPLVFLPRHGDGHSIPPHLINYRANIRALSDAGVDEVIALAAVGGIGAGCDPCVLCVPDQLVDYTHGRQHTFFTGGSPSEVVHVDVTEPYCASLRQDLLAAATTAGIAARDGGTYGVTQGPRLETAAEIRRLERDGCDLVGMTAMPEAALSRELGLCYATLAFIVNRAAGKGLGPIGMDEINANLTRCRGDVHLLLTRLAEARR